MGRGRRERRPRAAHTCIPYLGAAATWRPATWHPFTRLPRLACHVYRQVIKCDINAIITSGEPPSAVRAWVSCIETIHQMRTNTGVPIRDAVNLAIRTSKDALPSRIDRPPPQVAWLPDIVQEIKVAVPQMDRPPP